MSTIETPAPLRPKEVESVESAHVRPGDVVVIRAQIPVSLEEAKTIERYVQSVWPNHKVVILDPGLSLLIARACDEQAVVVGDRMRMSVELIKNISEHAGSTTEVVRVVGVDVEDDGCKRLIVERA